MFAFYGCQQDKLYEDESVEVQEDIVGVWINYNEIHSLVSKCSTTEELNEEINEMLSEFVKYKINTVFLHCRAFDDCFYSSEIFTPSIYCCDDSGNLKFNVLDAFIENSAKYNIEVHAWINPYRIRNDNNADLINKNSLAGKWYEQNALDQRIIITENSIFYNPASIEVQKYILDGIKEILNNYSIDGIHIDDYFYPTTDESIDTEFYLEYINNGGTLSLENFRRENINTMISSIYSIVKSYGEDMCFSISPSADIETNYSTFYADVELWASEHGYADYLIPQLYFGFEHETMPFADLLIKWSELKLENVKIAIGLSVYKSGEVDVYAKSGSNEWIDNSNILKKQIDSILNNQSLDGYAFYSSKYLLNNYNLNLENEKLNILS